MFGDICLIRSYNNIGGLSICLFICNDNLGTKGVGFASYARHIHHFSAARHIFKLGNAPFNEGLAFTRGMIFGILRKIAMFTRFGNGANNCLPFHGFQIYQLRL